MPKSPDLGDFKYSQGFHLDTASPRISYGVDMPVKTSTQGFSLDTSKPYMRYRVKLPAGEGSLESRPGIIVSNGINEVPRPLAQHSLGSGKSSLTEIRDEKTGLLEGWEIMQLPRIEPRSLRNFRAYINDLPEEVRKKAAKDIELHFPYVFLDSDEGVWAGPEDMLDAALERGESFEDMMIRRDGYLCVAFAMIDASVLVRGSKIELPMELSIVLLQAEPGEIISEVDKLLKTGRPTTDEDPPNELKKTLDNLVDCRLTIYPHREHIEPR